MAEFVAPVLPEEELALQVLVPPPLPRPRIPTHNHRPPRHPHIPTIQLFSNIKFDFIILTFYLKLRILLTSSSLAAIVLKKINY